MFTRSRVLRFTGKELALRFTAHIFVVGHCPPTSTASCPCHIWSVFPGLPILFHSSASVYYTECKQKDKKLGSLGTTLSEIYCHKIILCILSVINPKLCEKTCCRLLIKPCQVDSTLQQVWDVWDRQVLWHTSLQYTVWLQQIVVTYKSLTNQWATYYTFAVVFNRSESC